MPSKFGFDDEIEKACKAAQKRKEEVELSRLREEYANKYNIWFAASRLEIFRQVARQVDNQIRDILEDYSIAKEGKVIFYGPSCIEGSAWIQWHFAESSLLIWPAAESNVIGTKFYVPFFEVRGVI